MEIGQVLIGSRPAAPYEAVVFRHHACFPEDLVFTSHRSPAPGEVVNVSPGERYPLVGTRRAANIGLVIYQVLINQRVYKLPNHAAYTEELCNTT